MYLSIEKSYHRNIEAYVKLEVYIYRLNTPFFYNRQCLLLISYNW